MRMKSDDDDFFDRVHLSQHVHDLVVPPSFSHESFFFYKKVVAILHVKNRIAFQRIFVISSGQESSEAMLGSGRASERRHQLAHAASCVSAKKWINVQRRS